MYRIYIYSGNYEHIRLLLPLYYCIYHQYMHITWRITLWSTSISKSSQPYTSLFSRQIEVLYIASVNSQAFDVSIVKIRWYKANYYYNPNLHKTIFIWACVKTLHYLVCLKRLRSVANHTLEQQGHAYHISLHRVAAIKYRCYSTI